MAKYRHLSLAQRQRISECLASGWTQRDISIDIGVDKSTVSREVRRNKSLMAYKPQAAERLARERLTKKGRLAHSVRFSSLGKSDEPHSV